MARPYLLRIPLILVLAAALLVIGVVATYNWLPTLRCRWASSGLLEAGSSFRAIAVGNIDRCYLVYTPAGLEPGTPVPLVLSLHGFISNPQEQRRYSGWDELTEGVLDVSMEKATSPSDATQADWLRNWGVWNGCKRGPERSHWGDAVSVTGYEECEEGTAAIMFETTGSGHGWPGGPSIPFLGRVTQELEATDLMWRFFQDGQLPEQESERGLDQ